MTSFLFWNLNRKPIQKIVANLASLYEIDVIMLVECLEASKILESLNYFDAEFHYIPVLGCDKVEVFTRFPQKFISTKSETDRLTIRHLKLPGLIDILIAIVHLSSKVHWSDSSQAFECGVLINSIRDVEKKIGHSRTVLVGDLNMNPFEDGVVSANGFHGVMSRFVAKKGSRTVQKREYPYFYNPMWSLLGDASPSTPGTYYYPASENRVFFWNMFDQVLIRPDLLDYFNNNDLEIVQTDGNTSFLSFQGIPDKKGVSDHLPLVFKLSL